MIARERSSHTSTPFSHSIWLKSAGLGVCAVFLALPAVLLAQQAPSAPPAVASAAPVTLAVSKPPASAPKTAITPITPITPRSTWAELTPMQQQALKPLALSWDISMSDQQRRKWLEISRNFPSLSPEGQATMHSRMNEWIGLSPQQRAQARLNFARTKELSKKLTPEEKKATWQTYQALSPEEKQKLAATAAARPTGAATAVKPVPPQKLAAVPPRPASSKPAPKITPSHPAKALPAAPHTDAAATGTAPQR